MLKKQKDRIDNLIEFSGVNNGNEKELLYEERFNRKLHDVDFVWRERFQILQTDIDRLKNQYQMVMKDNCRSGEKVKIQMCQDIPKLSVLNVSSYP